MRGYGEGIASGRKVFIRPVLDGLWRLFEAEALPDFVDRIGAFSLIARPRLQQIQIIRQIPRSLAHFSDFSEDARPLFGKIEFHIAFRP